MVWFFLEKVFLVAVVVGWLIVLFIISYSFMCRGIAISELKRAQSSSGGWPYAYYVPTVCVGTLQRAMGPAIVSAGRFRVFSCSCLGALNRVLDKGMEGFNMDVTSLGG